VDFACTQITLQVIKRLVCIPDICQLMLLPFLLYIGSLDRAKPPSAKKAGTGE
jgi:hypothetical protein